MIQNKMAHHPTEDQIYNAAVAWCGQKDRETSNDDILYFLNNWNYFPGLEKFVLDEDKGK